MRGDKDLKIHFDRRFRWLFALIAVFSFLCFLSAYFFKEINFVKENALGILKEGHILVKAAVDKRKKNIFFSTSEFFSRLYQKHGELTSVMETRGKVSYATDKKVEERSVKLKLTNPYFSKAFQGKLKVGRFFNNNDLTTNSSTVVLGESFLRKYFDGQNTYPSTVKIGNKVYSVIGIWSWSADFLNDEEAEVFLLNSEVSQVADEEKTYFNQFVLKDSDDKGIEKLKSIIDFLQLESGFEPVRPDFEIVSVNATQSYSEITGTRLMIFEYLKWTVLFIIFIFLVKVCTPDTYQKNGILIHRVFAQGSYKKACLDITLSFLIKALVWSFTGFLVLLIFVFVQLQRESIGNSFHFIGFPIEVITVLFLPIVHYFSLVSFLRNRNSWI